MGHVLTLRTSLLDMNMVSLSTSPHTPGSSLRHLPVSLTKSQQALLLFESSGAPFWSMIVSANHTNFVTASAKRSVASSMLNLFSVD